MRPLASAVIPETYTCWYMWRHSVYVETYRSSGSWTGFVWQGCRAQNCELDRLFGRLRPNRLARSSAGCSNYEPSLRRRGTGGLGEILADGFGMLRPGLASSHGTCVHDDDFGHVARIRWEALTRKIYFDEQPRLARAHREFAAAVTAR